MVTSGDTHEQVAELVANLRTAPLGIHERSACLSATCYETVLHFCYGS